MVTIRRERPADVAAREALLDLSYGPARFTKASERLRAGRDEDRRISGRVRGPRPVVAARS